MKLYKKEGNILQIISFPTESAEKGDYLLVEDQDAAKALIAQVIDVQFAAVPGVLEELLRTLPDGGEPLQGEDIDPMEIAPHITYIQDASLLICKIRATLENEVLSPSSSWLPSRSQSTIKKLSIPMLMKLAKVDGKLPIILGGTKDSSLLTIDATAIDGTLNIITGKKGCGKSHLSKLLMVNLVGYKATVVILDLNGEYTSLGMSNDGKEHVLRQNPHPNAGAKLQSSPRATPPKHSNGHTRKRAAPARDLRTGIPPNMEDAQRTRKAEHAKPRRSHPRPKLQPARARRFSFTLPLPCQLRFLHRFRGRSNAT